MSSNPFDPPLHPQQPPSRRGLAIHTGASTSTSTSNGAGMKMNTGMNMKMNMNMNMTRNNVNVTGIHKSHGGKREREREDPIWEARHIEWPLPSTLPSFQSGSGNSNGNGNGNGNGSNNKNELVGGSNIGGNATQKDGMNMNMNTNMNTNTSTMMDNNTHEDDTSDPISSDNASASSSGGYLGNLLPSMGKILSGPQYPYPYPYQSSLSSNNYGISLAVLESVLQGRPMKPPRIRCTASANGWIISLVEMSMANINNNASGGDGGKNLIGGGGSIEGKNKGDKLSSLSSDKVKNKSKGEGRGKSLSLLSNSKNSNLTSNLPPMNISIRLISRWNVRRSTHDWIIIPPSSSPSPTDGTSGSPSPGSGNMQMGSKKGRIVHVFVDPTGNHSLFSGNNGDLFYCHSSYTSKLSLSSTGGGGGGGGSNSKADESASANAGVRKCKGFGLNTDGSGSFRHGRPWRDCIAMERELATSNSTHASNYAAQNVQLGLTPGCYVTAVGWNTMGSENNTRKILLGTSFGEIYEYELDVDHDGGGEHTSTSTNTNGYAASSGGGGSDDMGMASDTFAFNEERLPVLMVRLNESESGTGTGTGSGVVSGLHFCCGGHDHDSMGMGMSDGGIGIGNTTSMIMLAATSGLNKQTRLHSYMSVATPSPPPSPSPSRSKKINISVTNSFRAVFTTDESTSRRSFMELPGSINYADLKVCHHNFALRTETGIYYGSIDPALVSSSTDGSGSGMGMGRTGAVPWNKGGNGITDGGMLPYESSNIPISIAITPHHFVTLSETNEVRFINRVAKKTVQKERVDWIAMIGNSSGNGSGSGTIMDDGIYGLQGELIMDVRRPDQIWLRKSRSLIHISSTREDRDVWKFSLEACLKGTASIRGGGAYGSNHRTSMRRSHQQNQNSEDGNYMDAEFEHAKSLCTNDTQKAVVTAARAEFHLNNGRVELAAKYMAQCPEALMPFAETAIRLALPSLGIRGGASTGTVGNRNGNSRSGAPFSTLMSSTSTSNSHGKFSPSGKAKELLKEGNAGLISYLSDKLRSAKARNDGVACTMIGAWLVELHLHEREHSRKQSGTGGGATTTTDVKMQQMLSSNAYNMDAKTILRILCSHDAAASECASYAASSGDIGTAVNAALAVADYKNGTLSALRVLGDAPFEQAEVYYYKHAFTFLSRAPIASANAFLARFGEGLSATKLLPAFMQYEKKREELKSAKESKNDADSISKAIDSIQISGDSRISDGNVEISIDDGAAQSFVDDEKGSITYFEGAITLGCKSTAVFNYLVSLYVQMEDEGPLYKFLSTHISTNATAPGVPPKQRSPLDLPYALRILLRSNRHFRSVIKMYVGLGNRQRAVELAINIDPTLAKEMTRDSIEREEKKRLWLMIARNAAEEGESGDGDDAVSKVLAVLNECGPDVLSIEDVLPFLPDVAQIDQFKDEICDALTSYSSRIENFLKQMNDCDQTCNALRGEIRSLSDYTTVMDKDAKCAFTEKTVIEEEESFYVFPSGFVALETALKNEVLPYLNKKQKDRLEFLEKEMEESKSQVKNDASYDNLETLDHNYRIDALQSEIDGLIAAECPLTGSVMIDSIDHCFCDSKEDELYIGSNFSIEA